MLGLEFFQMLYDQLEVSFITLIKLRINYLQGVRKICHAVYCLFQVPEFVDLIQKLFSRREEFMNGGI